MNGLVLNSNMIFSFFLGFLRWRYKGLHQFGENSTVLPPILYIHQRPIFKARIRGQSPRWSPFVKNLILVPMESRDSTYLKWQRIFIFWWQFSSQKEKKSFWCKNVFTPNDLIKKYCHFKRQIIILKWVESSKMGQNRIRGVGSLAKIGLPIILGLFRNDLTPLCNVISLLSTKFLLTIFSINFAKNGKKRHCAIPPCSPGRLELRT